MTDLQKKVARRCLAPHRGRRMVVTLYPGDVIGIRPERTRREEAVSVPALYDWAVKQRVAMEKATKAAARKARGQR